MVGRIPIPTQCVVYTFGIIISLTVYGVLQERVMSQPYDGQYFTFSIFPVMCNRIASSFFAFTLCLVKKEHIAPKAPLWKYALIAMTNVCASSCQYECLKYVPFTVQMISKTFKILPVMLMGTVLLGKRYMARQWMVACSVAVGISTFIAFAPTEEHGKLSDSTWKGFGYLCFFLGFDSLTSILEERLFRDYQMHANNQILYVNMFSGGTAMTYMLCLRHLGPALEFSYQHHELAEDVAMMSMSAAMSQYFMFRQIQEFGALAFTVTLNIRQAFSIFLSYVTYGHPVLPLQMLGLFVIFMALFSGSAANWLARHKANDTESSPLLGKDGGRYGRQR
mmetsp:Transcript_23580/g.42602  ORF Transcript_23580/g.42602 Transcript_23580/m.42602 type:complete len:336 (-) Transcript_23580:104-1111(-)